MNQFAHIELNEKKLAKQTLNFIITRVQNTYLENTLYMRILDPRENYGNLNNHIDFLEERLSHLEFFVDLDVVEFKNNASRYRVFETNNLGQTVDNSRILGTIKFKKENFAKEIFWANENEEKNYQNICHFRSFDDKIIPEKKFYSVILNSPFFNVNGWIEYYQKLLDLKFPEFSEKSAIGKTIIKYKPFKGKYLLGIETDYQFCKNNFKKGWWEQPDYKLIIFEKTNKKEIRKIVTFEKFVHPHFDPPSLDFSGFFGKKTVHDVSEKETVIDDGTRKEFFDDGTVRLYNSEEFGDELKRHAYFYYDMLYHTTKEYIKFIEESFDPEE